MNHSIFRTNSVVLAASLLLAMALGFCKAAVCQDVSSAQPGVSSPAPLGDRISLDLSDLSGLTSSQISKDSYILAPGDSLSVNAQSPSGSLYLVNPEHSDREDSALVTVSPSGNIYLPLLGSLVVMGKSVAQVEEEIRSGLNKYIKHFTIDVSLAKPRTLLVWTGGDAEVLGPRAVSRAETASSAVLKSRINQSGSSRRIEITRNAKKMILDPYRVVVFGDSTADIMLESGDSIYVPPVTRWVNVDGEVVREGRFEMVPLSGPGETFCVRHLLQLAVGPTPMAALDKAEVDRIGPDGLKTSMKLDLRTPDSQNMVLQPGDTLVVPSIASFQPIIRMIGEFKGDGVYQRVVSGVSKDSSSPGIEVQNKSGIYSLKLGQTAGDVIMQTGGVTPQADLKRAYIIRTSGETVKIPLDLNSLIVKGDKSSDVGLESGDELVLPANENKIHVFGEVKSPGSYAYSPSRTIIDYLGDAGGPTQKARLSQARIVRGTPDAPKIMVMDLKRAITGKPMQSNPTLEAGDLIYIPSKAIGGWQDISQIIISTYSLTSILGLR